MPTQDEFHGRHKGEEIIVIGAGPSLKHIPFGFLESRTNIGVNLIRQWTPWLRLDYWLALDKNTLDPEVYDGLPSVEGILKFIPRRYENWARVNGHWNDEFVPMALLDRVEGSAYSDDYGTHYTSSLPAAAHLALLMGPPSRIFVTGFDCVRKRQSITHYQLPHFYNPDIAGEYETVWDLQFERLLHHAKARGCEIINLSDPTLSKLLPRGSYLDYWDPPDYKEVSDGSYILPSR